MWLDGKIYIGGVLNSAILCGYDAMKFWDMINIPICYSSLTTYKEKLVLVGGKESANGPLTNKLLSLKEGGEWIEDLHPMSTPRMRSTTLCTKQYLLVAGGETHQGVTDEVEVFDGNKWAKTMPIPRASCDMKSALLHGKWYLMGKTLVFSASVDTLIEIASSGHLTSDSDVWMILPSTPFMCMSIAALRGNLLAIGGGQTHHGMFRL